MTWSLPCCHIYSCTFLHTDKKSAYIGPAKIGILNSLLSAYSS